MKRLSIKSIVAGTAGPRLAVGALSFGAAFGALALLQITAADRLVDAGYDQAIAVASHPVDATVGHAAAVVPSRLLRLTAGPSPAFRQGESTAAPEHVWLTRPALHIEPAAVDPLAGKAPIIATSVGARFTVAAAGSSETFEVVDVREISAERLTGEAAMVDGAAKLLLVSCRVLAEGTSANPAQLVRFLVDASTGNADPAHAVRFPRAL
jgi:hypothetical protein